MACLRWAPLAWGALVWCLWASTAGVALARDRGLAALAAPKAPDGTALEATAEVSASLPPPSLPAPSLPPSTPPERRRGLAGIVVGWSGVGASLGSFALMATCGALIRRAKDQVDHDQLTEEISMDVAGALDDGARTCRTIYAAFGATAAGVGLLGLSIGYGRRHREARRAHARWRIGPWVDRRGASLGLSGEF